MTEVLIALPRGAIDELCRHAETLWGERRPCAATCWYFGNDYEHSVALRRGCAGSMVFAAVGDALNRAASVIEEEFIDLDRQLVRGTLSRLLWDASALGERNPYQSELLINACRYRVFLDAVARPGRHLFVVEEYGFATLLGTAASARGVEVKWYPEPVVRPFDARDTLRAGLRAVVGAGRELRRRWRSVRWHRAFRRKHPVPCQQLRQCDVLLVSWVGPRSFAPVREAHADAYWGRLPAMLAERGLKVGHLANPLDWIHPYEEILEGSADAAEPVLFVDDCVGWFDRVVAALLPAMFTRVGATRLELGGFDLSPVLRLEIGKESAKGHIRSSLRFRAIGRWLARNGVRPRVILHPYEGQSWEKMLRRGVRRHLPATRIGACQHAPFAPGYLSFFPSRDEIADGDIPDVLGVIGDWYGRRFAARGFPEERIAILGALRLEHLVAAPCAVAGRLPEDPTGTTVLCCCSIGFAESAELAVKAACAVAEDPGIALVINFHPVTDQRFRLLLQGCIDESADLPRSRITYSDRSARELVGAADVVVYNSSGAAFDALARGIPVVYVGCDTTLDFNKVPGQLCRRARTVDELRKILRSTRRAPSPACRATSPELPDFFAKPRVRPLLAALEPAQRSAD